MRPESFECGNAEQNIPLDSFFHEIEIASIIKRPDKNKYKILIITYFINMKKYY
jgi:hypothetical protein